MTLRQVSVLLEASSKREGRYIQSLSIAVRSAAWGDEKQFSSFMDSLEL